MTIEPREYQLRFIEDVRARYADGAHRTLGILPTGAGKTLCAAWIIRRAVERGRRALFAAGRTELIDQTVEKLGLAGVTDVRVIQAERDEGSRSAPVTVASINTLAMPRWMAQLPPADLVILDEAQHGPASTWAGVMRAYDTAHWLGLTATPARSSGEPMGDLFDSIVVGPSVADLIALGHLVPCMVWAAPAELPAGELALDPVAAYTIHGNGELAVVFCSSIDHARATAASFTGSGIPADIVTGKLARARRADVLQRWRTGALRVVCNVNVLTEGFDLPALTTAILARRFGYIGPYLQAIGRILRPSPETGKTLARVVDLCGSARKEGFGPPELERVYSLDGEGIAPMVRDAFRQCVSCGGMFVSAPRCPHCGAVAPIKPTPLPRVTGVGVSELGPAQPPRPRQDFPVKLEANRDQICDACRGLIRRGDEIYWGSVSKRVKHRRCPATTTQVST